MAKEANKTLIGVFVVGAIVLAVIGITIFGSGKFFQDRPTYVMYFPGSITGLSVGAPVEFRGVKIGQVSAIKATFDDKALTFIIAVYVQTDPKTFNVKGGDPDILGFGKYRFYNQLIEKGLKAQLKVKSFITGQLFISVDFYPNIPTKFAKAEADYPEIPTVPSDMEQLIANLQKIPITELVDRLTKAAEGIEKQVNSPEIGQAMKNLNLIMRDMNVLVNDVTAEVKPLAKSIRDTSDAARGTFVQAEKTLALNEGVPGTIAASFTDTMKKASVSLDQVRSTLASYERIADRNANVGNSLNKTLGELDAAARAIRNLADFLERHPESILKGKQPSQGE